MEYVITIVLICVLPTILSSFLLVNLLKSIKSDKEISTGTVWAFALCNAHVIGWIVFLLAAQAS